MKIRKKIYFWFANALLFIISQQVFAGWQVAANSGTNVPREPFFQTGRTSQTKVDYKGATSSYVSPPAPVPAPAPIHKTYSSYLSVSNHPRQIPARYGIIDQSAPLYAVSISGSVKENLERIMGRYHWRVVWKAPFDYNFDGRVTGASLPNVVAKLLKPFPLQAVMYMSNRTLAVVPRNPV